VNLRTAFVYGPYLMLLVTLGAFVLKCRLKVRAQAIWTMVLLACFSKFLVYRNLGGDAFTPDLPERVIWVWNWAYSGAFILGILGVLTMFFRVPKRVWLLPVLAWGLSAWGVWNGIAPPEVKEVTVSYPDLPPSLDGYRIVQISDVHVSAAARAWRTERIVEAANACDGDLIVLTGDYVDGLPPERARDVEPLKNLKSREGVYAILGNHEYYYRFGAWKPLYDKWGIKFLRDACVCPHPGLVVGGVDDATYPNVAKAFKLAPEGAFRVLLQHRPKHAEEHAAEQGVRLQLSGHTHGGVMPLFAEFVARFNGGYSRGLYALNPSPSPSPSYLYLSSGAGQWAGFPIRFFNPTEITAITLKREGVGNR